MTPEELVLYSTSLAIAIAKDKTTEELNTIAIVLSQISATLGMISIQRDNIKSQSEKDNGKKKDDIKEEEEEDIIAVR